METIATASQDNLLTYAATLHAQGQTSYEITESLRARGLSAEQAESVAALARQLYNDALHKKANKAILWGAIVLTIGTFVSIASYAGSGGNSYILAYGAILGGLIRLISGLVLKFKID